MINRRRRRIKNSIQVQKYKEEGGKREEREGII
jgi:hypothetical protein